MEQNQIIRIIPENGASPILYKVTGFLHGEIMVCPLSEAEVKNAAVGALLKHVFQDGQTAINGDEMAILFTLGLVKYSDF